MAYVAEILGPDMLIVLGIIALIFGAAKLPQLARSLGQAKAEFEKGQRGEGDDPVPADGDAPVLTEAKVDGDATVSASRSSGGAAAGGIESTPAAKTGPEAKVSPEAKATPDADNGSS